MPLLRVDETFVEHLENVGLDVPQAKARDLSRDLPHEVRAGRLLQRPVEEVAFDGAHDPLFGQGRPRQHGVRIIDRKVEHPRRDRLHHDHEVGVLQEQGVAAHLLPISFAEETIPQVALEPHLRVVLQLGPKGFEHHLGAGEGQAPAAKCLGDNSWFWSQIGAIREKRLQPRHQLVGTLGIRRIAREFVEFVAAHSIGDEGGAVGGKARYRRGAAGARRGVGDIVRHAAKDVANLPAQIALQLDDRGAPEGVDAAGVVEQIDLVRDVLVGRPEARSQQLDDVAAQGLMARPPGDRSHQLGESVLAPGHVQNAAIKGLSGPRRIGPTVLRSEGDVRAN